MARLLQHDDISKVYYREKNVKRILTELADEMERLIKKYPNCLYDASFIYSDFTYISILLVENNFVKRFVGPNKIEIRKPTTKAKEVNELIIFAWEQGIKSLYYQRSANPSQELARSILSCKSCEG